MTSEHTQRAGRGQGLSLVGYRGTGKSIVGRILAERSGRQFVDADLEIQARAGRTITSIFAEWGEPVFRDWEERTLHELAATYPGAILATGGGAVVRPSNRHLIARFGFVVWLQAEPAELARRLQSDPRAVTDRPSLTAAGTIAEIEQVLASRSLFYHEVADAEIKTQGKTPLEVAEAILDLWPR
jgi:shikimate kinase